VGEGVTAGAFPGYSYATNYISDLGIPQIGSFQGRTIDSPLHDVMNATFIGQGVLFALAGVIAAHAFRVGPWRVFSLLAVIHGVGLTLVGLIHGSEASVANGTAIFHVVGAGMAIVGANAAAILVGARGSRLGAPRAYCAASIVLGILGLISLAMLQIDSGSAVVNIAPDGVWERASVYTLIAWELMTGIALLCASIKKLRAGTTAV
jgi:hypothetical membrane protein